MFDGGIQRYSGLVDLAIEGGFVSKPSPGWYAKIDRTTGEIGDRVRFESTQTDEFWKDLLKYEPFKEYVKKKYEIAYSNIMGEDIQLPPVESTKDEEV